MQKNLKFEKIITDFNCGIKAGSQAYFAKKAKIPTQTISAWVNGRSVPTRENIEQLAKILKKDLNEIRKIFIGNEKKENDNDKNINTKMLLQMIEKQNKAIEEINRKIERLEEKTANCN